MNGGSAAMMPRATASVSPSCTPVGSRTVKPSASAPACSAASASSSDETPAICTRMIHHQDTKTPRLFWVFLVSWCLGGYSVEFAPQIYSDVRAIQPHIPGIEIGMLHADDDVAGSEIGWRRETGDARAIRRRRGDYRTRRAAYDHLRAFDRRAFPPRVCT